MFINFAFVSRLLLLHRLRFGCATLRFSFTFAADPFCFRAPDCLNEAMTKAIMMKDSAAFNKCSSTKFYFLQLLMSFFLSSLFIYKKNLEIYSINRHKDEERRALKRGVNADGTY